MLQLGKANEDLSGNFECEIIGCHRQASDVQLRRNPLNPKESLWICDACIADKQELADLKKKRERGEY